MPTYTFKNEHTDQIEEHYMSISSLDGFKESNPHLIRVFVDTVPLGDPIRLGVRKQDGGWREVLQRVADRTPGGKGLRDSIR